MNVDKIIELFQIKICRYCCVFGLRRIVFIALGAGETMRFLIIQRSSANACGDKRNNI